MRSRARRAIDLGKLSAAVARPGIDPRTWVTLATVIEVGFDADNSYYADVAYLPSGEEQTCLVGSAYTGNNFGIWTPLEPDDVVVVIVPNGDSNAGPIIVARLWNSADKPPTDGGEGEIPTDDLLVRVKSGHKLRLRTSGTGGDSVTQGVLLQLQIFLTIGRIVGPRFAR